MGASALEGSLKKWSFERCAMALFDGQPGRWRDLWLDVSATIQTARFGCLYEYLSLGWNGTHFSDHPDVIIRPKDWGGLAGIASIIGGPRGMRAYPYFKQIIELMRAIGYVPGENLRGAPYDWRIGYDERLYPKMQSLIEEMSNAAGGRKVWIIGHSMGGLQASTMLGKATDEWKHNRVAGLITLGTPWLGASSPILALLSGFDLDIKVGPWKVVDDSKLHSLMKHAGGLVWLLPRANISNTNFLIKAGDDEFGVNDLPAAFLRKGLTVPLTDFLTPRQSY